MTKRIEVCYQPPLPRGPSEEHAPSRIEFICTRGENPDRQEVIAERLIELLQYQDVTTLEILYNHPRFQEWYRGLGPKS